MALERYQTALAKRLIPTVEREQRNAVAGHAEGSPGYLLVKVQGSLETLYRGLLSTWVCDLGDDRAELRALITSQVFGLLGHVTPDGLCIISTITHKTMHSGGVSGKSQIDPTKFAVARPC